MRDYSPRSERTLPDTTTLMKRISQRQLVMFGVTAVAIICVVVALTTSSGEQTAAPPTTIDITTTTTTSIVASGDPTTTTISVATTEAANDEPCTIRSKTLNGGSSGDDVICLQQALIDAGYLDGTPSGRYDNATAAAVALS